MKKPTAILLRKSFFTLFEILIALTILLMISALFYVSVRALFGQETFKASSARLVSLCNNAADLSQILHVDNEMEFISRDGKVEISFVPIGSLTSGFDRWFRVQKIALDGVDSVFLQGSDEKTRIVFNDRGFDFPKGILRISGGNETAYILLPGYPSPFRLSFEPIDFSEFLQRESLFKERLTSSTFTEMGRYAL